MKKLYPLLSLSLLTSITLTVGCNPMKADRWMNIELKEALDGEVLLGMSAINQQGYIDWNYKDACATSSIKIKYIGDYIFSTSIGDATFLSRRTLKNTGTRARGHIEEDLGTTFTIDSALSDMRHELHYTYSDHGFDYVNGRTIDYTVSNGHLSQEVIGVKEAHDKTSDTINRKDIIASGSINNSRTLTRFKSHGEVVSTDSIELIRAKKYTDGILVGMSIRRNILSMLEAAQYDTVTTGVFAINTLTGELVYAQNYIQISSGATQLDDPIEEKDAVWSKLRSTVKIDNMCSQAVDGPNPDDKNRTRSFNLLKEKIEYFEMYETWMSAVHEKRRIEDTNAAYLKTLVPQLSELEAHRASDWKDKIAKMF